jgi:histidine triad (HIT) family protein
MENCIFCKIIEKTVPSKIVLENSDIIAFESIEPKAPVHILIVPKRHIPSVNYLNDDDAVLVGKMIVAAKKIAESKNIDETGYRLTLNTGPDAGQSVFHIHLHLMGGKKFQDEA